MSSLFVYCTSVLHYSEHGAFNRIEVAPAARRPPLLEYLEDGSLHLAGARLLAPHLTAENIDMTLAAARHKSKREIEEVAAGLARRAMLVAVAAEQYRLHLTSSAAAVKDALVRDFKVPAGRLTTAGFGESRPRETNETIAGRARNRRVELMRDCER